MRMAFTVLLISLIVSGCITEQKPPVIPNEGTSEFKLGQPFEIQEDSNYYNSEREISLSVEKAVYQDRIKGLLFFASAGLLGNNGQSFNFNLSDNNKLSDAVFGMEPNAYKIKVISLDSTNKKATVIVVPFEHANPQIPGSVAFKLGEEFTLDMKPAENGFTKTYQADEGKRVDIRYWSSRDTEIGKSFTFDFTVDQTKRIALSETMPTVTFENYKVTLVSIDEANQKAELIIEKE